MAEASHNRVINLQNQIIGGILSGNPGVFPTGTLTRTQKGSQKASVNPTFLTPSVERIDSSVLASGRLNLSSALGLASDTNLMVGGFAGWAGVGTDFNSNAALRQLGINRVGEASNSSFMGGVFGAYVVGSTYAVFIASGDVGETETANFATGGTGTYDTSGYVVSGALGTVLTLSTSGGGLKDAGPQNAVKLDVRGALTYSDHEGDEFTDSAGVNFGESETEIFSGSASLKLFLEQYSGNVLNRPYIQVGVKHRFEFDSTLTLPAQTFGGTQIATTSIDFDDDETFFNVEVGNELISGDGYKLNISGYYEGSDDTDTYGGRLGIGFDLN